MFIKNTNLRRIVSLLFVLCLIFCLVPTAAFAEDNEDNDDYIETNTGTINNNSGYIDTNKGKVFYNNGTIETNDEAVINYVNYDAESGGNVVNNSGRIEVNNGLVYSNDGDAAIVETNYGTVAYNKSIVETNHGTVAYNITSANNIVRENYGTVEYNDGTVEYNLNNGTVETNNGTVADNNAKIVNNNFYVNFNNGDGTVETNNGTVEDNRGTVVTNYETVEVNIGTVETNNKTVVVNFGNVNTNNGTVIYNCGGTVEQGYRPRFDCFYVKIDPTVLADDIPSGPLADYDNSIPEYGVVYRQDETGNDCKLWGVKDNPLTLTLNIKSGYEPYIKAGNGSIVKNDDGTYTISASLPGITVDVRPVSTSSVPATADMSNVPLWSALLLVFAATAILTRKKKNG